MVARELIHGQAKMFAANIPASIGSSLHRGEGEKKNYLRVETRNEIVTVNPLDENFIANRYCPTHPTIDTMLMNFNKQHAVANILA